MTQFVVILTLALGATPAISASLTANAKKGYESSVPGASAPQEAQDASRSVGGKDCASTTVKNEDGALDDVETCVEFLQPTSEVQQWVTEDLSTLDLSPLPEWCTTDPAIGSWRFTRTQSCGIHPGVLTVTTNGILTGLMTFVEYGYLYTSLDEPAWGFQIEISPKFEWGTAVGGSISGRASCSGEVCDVVESTFPRQPVSATGPIDAQGESFYEMELAEDDVLSASSAWTYQFHAQGGAGTSSPIVARPYTDVRCDDVFHTQQDPGCVLPDYTPTYVESLSGPAPSYAQHLRDALDSGLPGAPDDEPLTRLVSPTLNERNRDTACPDASDGGYPRPPGFSCDEYPFASTAQGAYTANLPDPPFPGRTFDWCQISTLPTGTGADGWSACMIPERENSVGGGRLGAFYLDRRVIDGDDFHVDVTA